MTLTSTRTTKSQTIFYSNRSNPLTLGRHLNSSGRGTQVFHVQFRPSGALRLRGTIHTVTSRSELSDSSYVFSAAIALAIMAIATNIVACLAFGPTSLPLGNIFLFICAAAFGPLPGALCVTAGVLPVAMVTGEVFGTLRLMVLVGAVGAWRKYNHTTPMHLIAVVTWILFIAPCLMLISQAGLTTTVWSGELLIKWALFECVACLVADSLLLTGWLWTKLTRSPRVTPLKTSISYAITTIGVGSLLIAAFCSF